MGGVLVALAVLVGAAGSAYGAAAQDPSGAGSEETAAHSLSIVKVSGLLDPVLVDFLDETLTEAEAKVAAGQPGWLVLQLNSSGAVADDERVAALLERMRTSSVSVAVWVGPSGSDAKGAAAQLAAVADVVGVAPGSSLGQLGEPLIDPTRFTQPFQAAGERLADSTVNAETAVELELAAEPAPVVGDFVISLDGVATKVVQTDDGPRRATDAASTPVFRALPIGDQLMHTVASPAVAYLLFVIGMALIVFELYTAGVGVAGLVGAGSFLLGAYGLGVLPVRVWAVALLVGSMVAFAIDVQTGIPRAWTTIGGVAFIVGSFALYDGLSLSWITLLVGVVGTILFMLAGMPAMVRTRFSTPTIGRDWMIGEEGEAVADVAPDGVVRVRGALWRARTNRATPLVSGAAIRVVEVDGLLLEVEPLDGGAKDYRR